MVLLTPWALFQGASEEIIERAKEEGDDDVLTEGGTALEVSRPFQSSEEAHGRWPLSAAPNGSSGVHLVRKSSKESGLDISSTRVSIRMLLSPMSVIRMMSGSTDE